MQGTRGPPTRGAETRQSTDQVEPVRSVRSRAVKGRVHPERRACLHSGGSRHLRPSGSPGGPGDSEKRSESCHWASRLTGPLRVSTPHLQEASECLTPGPTGDPARRLARWRSPLRRPGWPSLALATDSALGPQRSRIEWGAPSRGRAGVRRRPLEQTTRGRGRYPACESMRSKRST